MKACTRCGEEKVLDDFHRRPDVPDGRASHCKVCQKEKSAEYYKKNRERIGRQTATYRKTNPEVSQRASAKWRKNNPEYIKANREHARLVTRQWCKDNPERKKAADKRWYDANYVKRTVYHLQARDKGFAADDDTQDWLSIIRADPCAYCGEPMTEVDHIEPRNRWLDAIPGWNGWSNLTSSCRSCNRRKSDRLLLTFLLLQNQ